MLSRCIELSPFSHLHASLSLPTTHPLHLSFLHPCDRYTHLSTTPSWLQSTLKKNAFQKEKVLSPCLHSAFCLSPLSLLSPISTPLSTHRADPTSLPPSFVRVTNSTHSKLAAKHIEEKCFPGEKVLSRCRVLSPCCVLPSPPLFLPSTRLYLPTTQRVDWLYPPHPHRVS